MRKSEFESVGEIISTKNKEYEVLKENYKAAGKVVKDDGHVFYIESENKCIACGKNFLEAIFVVGKIRRIPVSCCNSDIINQVAKYNIPKLYLSVLESEKFDLKKIPVRVVEYSKKIVENVDRGIDLAIYGNCGTGKSVSICWLLKTIVDNGHNFKTRFFECAELQAKYNAFEIKFDTISDLDILVLDNFGKNFLNNFARSFICSVIDYRKREMKPVFYTINETPEEIKKNVDPMILDRLQDQRTMRIEMSGVSMRSGCRR